MCDRMRPVTIDIWTRHLHTILSLYNEKPELESHSLNRSLKPYLLAQPLNPRSSSLTLEELLRYALSDVGLVNSNVVSCRGNLSSQIAILLLCYCLNYITFFNLTLVLFVVSVRSNSSLFYLFFIILNTFSRIFSLKFYSHFFLVSFNIYLARFCSCAIKNLSSKYHI